MLEAINPATQQPLGEVPLDSEETITQKNLFAHMAYKNWSQEKLADRVYVFKKLADVIAGSIDELAQQICLESGVPLSFAKEETQATVSWLQKIIYEAEHHFRLDQNLSEKSIGVIGIFGDWPHALLVGLQTIAPALIAGNSCLYYGSLKAPLMTLTITGLLKEAGLPNGVFAPVIAKSKPLLYGLKQPHDRLLLLNPEKTAPQLNAHTFSLSPLPPVFYWENVEDSSIAKEILKRAFMWNGQSPWSLKQVLVPIGRAEDACLLLQKLANDLSPGNPMDEKKHIGPLIDPNHIKIHNEHLPPEQSPVPPPYARPLVLIGKAPVPALKSPILWVTEGPSGGRESASLKTPFPPISEFPGWINNGNKAKFPALWPAVIK